MESSGPGHRDKGKGAGKKRPGKEEKRQAANRVWKWEGPAGSEIKPDET